jgi:hypothetical protein
MLSGKGDSAQDTSAKRPAWAWSPSFAICAGVTTSLLAASALAVLAPTATLAAVIVDVDGKSYEVKSSQYTLQNYESLLAAQPWFGDQAKAERFANAVAAGLGYPNTYTISSGLVNFSSTYGPVFIFQGTYPVPTSNLWGATVFGPNDPFPLQGQEGGAISYVGPLDQWEFFGVNSPSGDFIATAQEVPAPLPIFGVSAAFGFSRQIRRRLKGIL